MAEVEIGIGKSARQAYSLDEVSIVPSRRTRNTADVDVSWEIDAFQLDLPIMTAPMDGVSSPATAIEVGRLGGVGVLDLEGLWSRFEDPTSLFDEIAALPDEAVTPRLQELYATPLQPELVLARIAEIRSAGVVACGAVTPQRLEAMVGTLIEAELDLLVVHGTVVSAEHVSRAGETLDLKRFVRELDLPVIVGGCSSYQAALHLMRTGAAGVLVGVGAGSSCTTPGVLGVGVPQATAIADVRGARMRHLDETGVYVHLIADGGMATGGDIAKAIVCGADAVMVGEALAAAAEAPGQGYHWGRVAAHRSLPRAARVRTGVRGTLEELLLGPSSRSDGRVNLVGGLRTAMATTGHRSVKELQKAELVVGAPRRGASA